MVVYTTSWFHTWFFAVDGCKNPAPLAWLKHVETL